MKPRTLLLRLLSFAFGTGLILALLMLSIRITALNKGFYHDFYEDYQLAEKENIRQEDAVNGIDMMVDYVLDHRDDLDGTIFWKEKFQPTFNEKEKSHMVDVKNLWQNARKAGIFGGLAALVCAFLVWRLSRTFWLAWLCQGFLLAGVCLMVVLTFFGFWMAIDFTELWIQFHHLFFTNELWALDPWTDFMIVICPESLFFTMILRICLSFAIPLLLLACFSIYYLKKKTVIGFEREKQS